jgi:hypothetical protein
MERMQPLAKEQLNPIQSRINTASKVVNVAQAKEKEDALG